MELQVWEGDWGLPSVDHDSLAVLAYCKLANIAVDVKKLKNPWKSVSGTLPVLSNEGENFTEVRSILNFLKTQNATHSQSLATKESADTFAFAALIEEKLRPAFTYVWWVDTKSYLEFTRPWYCKRLPIPLSWYLPQKWRNEAIARLEATSARDQNLETEVEAQLMKDAKECLNLLSTKLGDKQYFIGDKPTVVDALAFSYLAPLLNVPLPGAALQNHLKACRNLVQFCQRILISHFPLSPEEQERNRKLAEEARQKQAEDMEFPHKRRNMVIAVAVVVGAMVGFALLNGLIQLEFVDVEQKHPSSPKNVKRLLDEKEEAD